MLLRPKNTYQNVARKKFAARIRELRIQKRLTQEEFAYKAKFSRGYASRVESGDANLSFNTIVNIANALGVEPFELFKS